MSGVLTKRFYWAKLALMSILLPGIAHFSMNYKKLAIFYPCLLVIGIAIISWSGLIFLPLGGWVLIGWIGLIYLLAFYDVLKKSIPYKIDGNPVIWWHTGLYIIILASTILLLLLYKNLVFGFQLFQIPSQSMQPKLNPGDLVLADTRWFSLNDLRVEDIIVFKRSSTDDTFYIKRIIASDNDEIEVEEGVMKVNGKVIKENISPNQIVRRNIESNNYFVMGDNDKHSYDSRHWGGVQSKNIVAKYVRTLSVITKTE